MSRTRDWRRAQKDRYLDKARRYYKEVAGFDLGEWEKNIHRRANTRCPCSSWCCGNPRKHFNAVSFQEARFACSHEDDLKEVGVEVGKEKNDPSY